MRPRVSGLVIELPEGRRFLRRELARKVVPPQPLGVVPGSELRLALVSGHIICVISVSEWKTDLILCEVAAGAPGLSGASEREQVAISGARVVFSGEFDSMDGGVEVEGEVVPPLLLPSWVGDPFGEGVNERPWAKAGRDDAAGRYD